MEREERRRREEELDRFWEIDALLPKRRTVSAAKDTETVEVTLERPDKGNPSQEVASSARREPIPPKEGAPTPRFIPPHSEKDALCKREPELEYEPDNALVRRVRIYPWKSNYPYYESFVRDAERLYAVRGGACQRVPFFSYVPQYAQMNRAQLEWYLWWRTCVREGSFPDTDYSYVLLYAYELLNLSHKTEPLKTQAELCKLWLAYRSTFYRMDTYLPDWICDFSLLHRLPPPKTCEGEALSVVMAHCSLKEFYLPCGGEGGYARALLAFCSNYSYRKSKFCTDENRPLFDRVILGAIEEVSRRLCVNGRLFAAEKMDDSRLLRESYVGALCSSRIKRKIEVEYCSFSRSHELRFFITDVVKYTENRIRQFLGIRSRLGVYSLSPAVKSILDGYVDRVLPSQRKTEDRARTEAPAPYERYYDLPRREVSLERAAEIEQSSWDTTERLIETFSEESDPPLQEPALPHAPFAAQTEAETVAKQEAWWAPYSSFLRAALCGDLEAQRLAARERGVPLDVLADDFNALAFDNFGDILLEESDRGFAALEEYRADLEAMLEKKIDD